MAEPDCCYLQPNYANYLRYNKHSNSYTLLLIQITLKNGLKTARSELKENRTPWLCQADSHSPAPPQVLFDVSCAPQTHREQNPQVVFGGSSAPRLTRPCPSPGSV